MSAGPGGAPRPGRRRWAAVLLLACLLQPLLPPAPVAARDPRLGLAALLRPEEPPPPVEAPGYVVMDEATGQVLAERQGDVPRPPASITKILTALVVLERSRPDDRVTVSRQASEVQGSRVYLSEGSTFTVRQLLLALMLASANDAAVALAEHVAGSEAAFARLLDQRAAQLGARTAHFVNASGLPAPGHVASPLDMAVIARAALRNPAFRQLVSVKEADIPWNHGDGPRHLVNHNRLLFLHPDVVGVKNGYTVEAGQTLVLAVRRGTREILVVTMGGGLGNWEESYALADWAFRSFYPVRAVDAGQRFLLRLPGGRRVEAEALRPLQIDLPVGSPALQIRVQAGVRAPSPGRTVGWAGAYLDGRLLGRVPLRQPAPVAGQEASAGAGPGRKGWEGWLLLLVLLAGGAWEWRLRRLRRRRLLERQRRRLSTLPDPNGR
ncbi:MAG: D-alanyl-D-alanine carboxypeptidase family protein [Bacillota bacterium]|nr:D-alanyl-D-alanine carboxypeptidase family protein [Bacillota bacterium]